MKSYRSRSIFAVKTFSFGCLGCDVGTSRSAVEVVSFGRSADLGIGASLSVIKVVPFGVLGFGIGAALFAV